MIRPGFSFEPVPGTDCNEWMATCYLPDGISLTVRRKTKDDALFDLGYEVGRVWGAPHSREEG